MKVSSMKVRIFKHPDGTLTLVRPNREAEAEMDRKYLRISNRPRWVERVKTTVDSQMKFFKGHCYIIGKGPTLDKVQNFPLPSPVICINESIFTIAKLNVPNRLYSIQQDPSVNAYCEGHPIFVPPQITKYRDAIYYNPADYGLDRSSITVLCAIEIAKSLGVLSFDFIGFDAPASLEYAPSIGHSSRKGGSPSRFENHRALIIERCDARFIAESELSLWSTIHKEPVYLPEVIYSDHT